MSNINNILEVVAPILNFKNKYSREYNLLFAKLAKYLCKSFSDLDLKVLPVFKLKIKHINIRNMYENMNAMSCVWVSFCI